VFVAAAFKSKFVEINSETISADVRRQCCTEVAKYEKLATFTIRRSKHFHPQSNDSDVSDNQTDYHRWIPDRQEKSS
jgi:hypothetical protein